MIEISKTSLSYRFMLYGTFFEPKWKHQHNLCPFVRRMVLGWLLTAIVWPAVISFFIIALLTPIVHAVTALYFWDSSYFFVQTHMFLIGMVIYGLVFVAILSNLAEAFVNKRKTKAYEENFAAIREGRPPKKESVIIHYIKAIHDKICPEISIVDQ